MYKRFARRAAPLLIWLLAAAAAYWLHRQSAGGGQAAGLAEVKEFTVSVAEAGRLASVEVAPGQMVFQGQMVGRLETGGIEREIAVAEAELRELEARIPAEDRTLQLGRLQEERAFLSAVEEARSAVEAAQSAASRDRAELAALDGEIRRQRQMAALPPSEAYRLNELEVRRAALSDSVAGWPARIEGLERREQAARQRLAGWLSIQSGVTGADARREQMLPLELRVARQLKNIELLKTRLDTLVLRSPANARVTSVVARPGAVLRPGEPVLVLVEEAARVVAYADEERGYRVAVGDRAEIRPRSGDGARAEGTVVSVAGVVTQIPSRFWPSANRPRWGREVFIVLDPSHGLDPGQGVDVTFQYDRGAATVAAGGGPGRSTGLKPLSIPSSLLDRSRLEPSGLVWVDALERYLTVSDDTGQDSAGGSPAWLFAISSTGAVDPHPIPIEGVDAASDLEAITAAPDGMIYVIASQAESKDGKRRPARTVFIQARPSGGRLKAVARVFLYDLLLGGGREDPAFFASLGLGTGAQTGGPALEIEGLSWHQGALLLGLKAPVDQSGRALIWKIGKPERLFAGGSLREAGLSLWARVALRAGGEAAGISDLLSLGDGSLLVAATNRRGGALFRARPSGDGNLATEAFVPYPGLKPEGLCLAPGGRRVTVVFDRGADTPLWTQVEAPR